MLFCESISCGEFTQISHHGRFYKLGEKMVSSVLSSIDDLLSKVAQYKEMSRGDDRLNFQEQAFLDSRCNDVMLDLLTYKQFVTGFCADVEARFTPPVEPKKAKKKK